MEKLEKLKPYIFLTIIFILCLALSSNALGYDYDLWARLIVGKAVAQTGSVLSHDFLSYTPTHLWIDHEWGSSVVFYLTLKMFGATGILVLQAVLTFLIILFVYKTIEIHIPKHISKYNIGFYFIGIYILKEFFNYPVRCHMFSFLFFAVFIYILELARIKNINKPLILIPILTIVWNNLHGGVVAGIGLVFIYLLGELLNRKPIKKYVLVFTSMIPLLIINPYGFKYLAFLFNANTMSRTEITEWWGLFTPYYFFGYMGFKIFALLFLILELVKTAKGGFSYKNADKTKFLLIMITLYLAVEHVKLIRFFVIVVMIFGYLDFYELIKNNRLAKFKNIVIYTLIILFTTSLFKTGDFRPKLSFLFPVLETEFVKTNNLKGNILVNMGLGSYVAYKLYPNNLIYMDGRYEEVYYDEMIPLLKKFHLVINDWDEVLEKYPPDIMILENIYPVVRMLENTKGWELAYRGNRFTVFVSDKIKKDKYKEPTMNTYYYESSIFDTDIDFRKKNDEK